MAAILTAILSAAGAAIGISEGSAATAAGDNAETVSIVGGVLLLLVLATAYYCGGYVAGRMSRFDGKRQGFGVWAIGLLVTIAIAAAAAIFGSEYNVLNQLNLPRIPIDEGDLATGGAIALLLALGATLLGAILGGAKGRHYHDRVDRAGGRDW
jgi:MFS family permease